jgi:predicted dehydrogenase
MIRVGIVGLGFMGMVHYLSYRKLPGVRVVGICELDSRRRAGDWTTIKGNFGPSGEQMDLSGITVSDRLDDLLAMEDLDLVDVTLPPALHAGAALAALNAGKHVLCEKPMALELAECEQMEAAARANRRRLFIGQVLPFFPEYAWALETVRSGQFGGLRGAAFRRVVADPTWVANYWSPTIVGGPLFDLHVHDAHFIRLLFGMPSSAAAAGRMRGAVPEFWHTHFKFANDPFVVEATSGTIDQQGRAFDHGFEIHLERATLLFEFAVLAGEGRLLCPPTVLDERGAARQLDLGAADPMDAFEAELRHVLECLEQDYESDILAAPLAKDAIRLCHMQADSLRSASGAI